MSRWNRAFEMLIGILLCEGVGLIAGWVTQTSVTTWYPMLQKPAFTPPGWIFAPVWTVLYALMGIAAVLIWWRRSEDRTTQAALTLFAVQLLVNGSWSFAFFGAQSPGLGLIVILILLALVAWTTLRFYRSRRIAGVLLLPYLLWVGYATALNAGIWILNS